LIYLNDVEEGGETSFPELGFSVKPKKGMGVFFGSLDKSGNCDKRTKHVGAKVTVGEKKVLQRWYYKNFITGNCPATSILCDGGNNCRHYIFNETIRRGGCDQIPRIEKLNNNNQADEAEKLAKKALAVWPWTPYTNAVMGQLLAMKGDRAGSTKYLKAALETCDKFPDPYYFLCMYELDARRFDKAEACYRKLLESKDAMSTEQLVGMAAWRSLALSLQGQGLWEDALNAVEAHLRLAPTDSEGRQLKLALQRELTKGKGKQSTPTKKEPVRAKSEPVGQKEKPAAKTAVTQLRAELVGMKLSALKKRAKADGVAQASLREADDADDIKSTVIELVSGLQAQQLFRIWLQAQQLFYTIY
jgi:hypothetical protein